MGSKSDSGTKKCNKCGQVKPQSEFWAKRDGLQPNCIPCSKKRYSNYYEENREDILEQKKEYYQENREDQIESASEWNRNNPKKRSKIMSRQNAKRRARKKENGGDGVTAEDWSEMLARAEGKCIYCGGSGGLTMDHVVPISRGGKDGPCNVVPACSQCNYDKNAKKPEDWVVSRFGRQRWQEVQAFLP